MDNAGDLKMQDTSPEAPLPAAPRNGFFNRHFYWFVQASNIMRQFWIVVVLAVWGTICYLLISHFIIISVAVDGQSMAPTLENSGHYWLNRFAYLRSDPHPLDIVVLKDPRDNVLVVKRIIGMPGQSVYFHAGKVYVDGTLLKEPYLVNYTATYSDETRSGDKFTCVPKGEYYVLGDNRNYSLDSRVFGPVARKNILGKLIE